MKDGKFAKLRLCQLHECQLAYGYVSCPDDARPGLESSIRARPLSVELVTSPPGGGGVVGTIQTLTSADVVRHLEAYLPGEWKLRHGEKSVPASCRLLRDSLDIPFQDAPILLHAELKQEHASERKKRLVSKMRKAQALASGGKTAPERANGARAVDRIKTRLYK